nr:MAG TPA: hypothetical protein [Bacteriophage sp.]
MLQLDNTSIHNRNTESSKYLKKIQQNQTSSIITLLITYHQSYLYKLYLLVQRMHLILPTSTYKFYQILEKVLVRNKVFSINLYYQ